MNDIDTYIRKLVLMSTDEIRALNERSRIEIEELKDEYKELKKENVRLTERYSTVEKEVDEINKTRGKTSKKIAKLEKKKNDLLIKLDEFDDDMSGLVKNFQEACEKANDVKTMYEEKCLDIRGSREEFKTKYNKLQDEIKEAEHELAHKKDSLAANQQVLESKIACLAKDEEDCAKKAKQLKSLTEKNNQTLLKELEQKEEDMKLEFSKLSAKLAEFNKCIDNLDVEKSSLTVETDKLSLELAVEEKCNQKLETELKNEYESLDKLIHDMVAMEINAIHCDNLTIAKILRDDLIKNEENFNAIQLLEKEKADIAKKNQEFDAIKEQKLQQLKKIEAEIAVSIEDKITLEKEISDFKNYALNIEEIAQSLKKQIAEKEADLKKQDGTKKTTKPSQPTTKPTQPFIKPSNPKTPPSKIPKAAKPKNKKTKEPPVTKIKESVPNPVEPMNISNDEQLDPNVFSSSSSGESHMSFTMSSSLGGSKPDIMNILANLSSNHFGDSSGRRNTGSTED